MGSVCYFISGGRCWKHHNVARVEEESQRVANGRLKKSEVMLFYVLGHMILYFALNIAFLCLARLWRFIITMTHI